MSISSSLESGMEEKPLLVDGSGCHSSTLALYPFLTWAGNSQGCFHVVMGGHREEKASSG